ncbi:HIT family protein [Nanoarchaeota archaeon]
MALTPEQAEEVRQKLLEQVEKLPEDQRKGLKEQVANATPEQLEAYLKPAGGAEGGTGGAGGGECLFCGIGKGTVDTVKVFEDASIVAFLDITPSKPGQIIITTKAHHQFLFQIPDHDLWNLVKVMKMLMPLLINATSAKGVSIYVAQGQGAGQVMDHISVNLIPRFDDDKAVFAWDRKQAEKGDLEKVGKVISEGVAKSMQEEKQKHESVVREQMSVEKERQTLAATEFPERPA